MDEARIRAVTKNITGTIKECGRGLVRQDPPSDLEVVIRFFKTDAGEALARVIALSVVAGESD